MREHEQIALAHLFPEREVRLVTEVLAADVAADLDTLEPVIVGDAPQFTDRKIDILQGHVAQRQHPAVVAVGQFGKRVVDRTTHRQPEVGIDVEVRHRWRDGGCDDVHSCGIHVGENRRRIRQETR